MAYGIEVKGIKEAQRASDDVLKQLQGSPMLDAVRKATLLVVATARQEAKVDTGRYRASIVGDVRTFGHVVEGIVGSNLAYAPYAVLDTRPHWPPATPQLVRWARRHGIPVFLVQRAIARKGTKGDQSLYLGIERNAQRIYDLLNTAATKACEAFSR